MANVRDSDTSLWLHNKLGTSNDTWIGGSICSQLNVTVLRNIRECFVDLQTQVKLKLLLVFLHTPRRSLEEWRTEVDEILEIAALDSDQWVSMLAELLTSFPATGNLNTHSINVEENRKIFGDLITELKTLVSSSLDMNLLPLECHYLNKAALVGVVGQLGHPEKHFSVRRATKAATLKSELLQKAHEASAQLKKSVVPAVPTRSRGMPRKMDNATPLKGIPSRLPSGGFTNAARASIGSLSRTPAARKEGRVKMLDINEQPAGMAQPNKNRRKYAVEDDELGIGGGASVKRQKSSDTSTPVDHGVQRRLSSGSASTETPPSTVTSAAAASVALAASNVSATAPQANHTTATTASAATAALSNGRSDSGLDRQPIITPSGGAAPYLPTPPPTITPHRTGIKVMRTPGPVPSQSPLSGLQQPSSPIRQLPPASSIYRPASQQHTVISTRDHVYRTPLTPVSGQFQQQPQQQQQSVVYQRVADATYQQTHSAANGNTQQQQPQQQQQQPQPQPQQQMAVIAQPQSARRGLALTRDQMLLAQQLFSTANKVTRPEKALILGFIAGSRENPCPHLGNVVTIKLSEDEETVMQPNGACVQVTVEMHFQMNYSSGEWKRIKKYTQPSTSSSSSTTNTASAAAEVIN